MARSQLERRLARLEEHHARATAPARWLCHVPACPNPGPHAASSPAEAEADAMRHYDSRHATDAPKDLEAQRAAWNTAGRPPLGAPSSTPPQHPLR